MAIDLKNWPLDLLIRGSDHFPILEPYSLRLTSLSPNFYYMTLSYTTFTLFMGWRGFESHSCQQSTLKGTHDQTYTYTAKFFKLLILKSKSKTNNSSRAYSLVLILILDFDLKINSLKNMAVKIRFHLANPWIGNNILFKSCSANCN